MSEYTINIPMDGYLKQYCETSFGSPAIFPRESPENRLLKCLLKQGKTSSDTTNNTGLIVALPYYKEKDPRVFNQLGPKAQTALKSSISELFKSELFKFMSSLENSRCTDKDLIYAFMEEKGIEDKYWDTISKIWYRIRREIKKKNNVKL